MTQEQIKTIIKDRLEKNRVWQNKALLLLYSYQTKDEQLYEMTEDANGRGFSYHDAEILSSFAVQLQTRGHLSEKQYALLSKKLPRYWKQIAKISDQEKLQAIYASQTGRVASLSGNLARVL